MVAAASLGAKVILTDKDGDVLKQTAVNIRYSARPCLCAPLSTVQQSEAAARSSAAAR